ncbi:MAG: twitching motility protein PilH [Anaerolineae bacterium]|jgi:CheY-like chemotaxis protein|nr:MAG: twitching motility protein PilH [Anaerolineae bacterium]
MAKILIVDDDPDFVEATRIVLEKAGHTTLSAASGNEGYEKMKAEKPDLVILDVIMDTVLDGLTITQRIHEDEEINKIPIIMVTSIANTDYAALFPTDEYIHINAFMSKPVEAAELIRQINKLLNP